MPHLICPKCHKQIKDYAPTAEVMECIHCQREIQIKNGLVSNFPKGNKEYTSPRITVQNEPGKLEIEVPWKRIVKWRDGLWGGLVLFLGSGIILVWMVLWQLYAPGVFMILFMIIGFRLIYTGFFQWYNRTKISLTKDKLSVHQRMNGLGLRSKTLAIDDLRQVWVQHESILTDTATHNYDFELLLLTKSGEELLIIKEFKDGEDAFFLERVIDSFLNI